MHIATFIYNIENGLFRSNEVNLNTIVTEATSVFDSKNALCALIFFLFIGLIILLTILQIPIGYWIVTSIYKESNLFLHISRKEYFQMVKLANAFLTLIKVKKDKIKAK